MKFTNKWIVVPYNTVVNKSKKEGPNEIFSNKSMNNEEKIAAYNYYLKKNIPKNNLEKEAEVENTEDNNISLSKSDTDDDDGNTTEIFTTPIKKETTLKTQNTPISSLIKKINDLTKSPGTLEKELFGSPNDSFKNLSMYNEPPAQNTRLNRNINNDLYKKVLSKNHNKKSKQKEDKKKTQKKQKHDQLRGINDSKIIDTSLLQDSVSWDPQFDVFSNKRNK
jgi:hypothetical protein